LGWMLDRQQPITSLNDPTSTNHVAEIIRKIKLRTYFKNFVETPICNKTKTTMLTQLSSILGCNTELLPAVHQDWAKGTEALGIVRHALEVSKNKSDEPALEKIFAEPELCPRTIKTEPAELGHVYVYTGLLDAAKSAHDRTSLLAAAVLVKAAATGLADVTREERGYLLMAAGLTLQTAIPNIRGGCLGLGSDI